MQCAGVMNHNMMHYQRNIIHFFQFFKQLSNERGMTQNDGNSGLQVMLNDKGSRESEFLISLQALISLEVSYTVVTPDRKTTFNSNPTLIWKRTCIMDLVLIIR